MLTDDVGSNLFNEGFPVWRRYYGFLGQFLTGPMSKQEEILSNRETHFCAWTASYINKAFLRFRPLSLAILLLRVALSVNRSFWQTLFNTSTISSSLGAGTRTSNVRERMGAMMLLVLFARRINLKLGVYFSIVLRSAACASLVK